MRRARLLLIALGLAAAFPAQAGQFVAKVTRGPPDKRIPDLTITVPQPALRAVTMGDEIRIWTFVEGKISRADWSVTTELSKGGAAQADSQGKFKLPVYIDSGSQTVHVLAISPLGEVKTEDFKVEVANWNIVSEEIRKLSKRKWLVLGSVGLSYLSYREEGVPDYSGLLLTAKVSTVYRFKPPNWDAAFNFFVTLLPLLQSGGFEGNTVRFLGFNARVGYVVPGISEPWSVSMMGGFYYNTMIVSAPDPEHSLGYNNVMGPQVFPTVRKILANGDVASAYFKFSPVGEGAALRSLADREIAFGAAWRRELPDRKKSLGVSLDVADFRIVISEVPISAQTISVGVTYGF
jgi:hypothetical protein